jgi:hypothetical protein
MCRVFYRFDERSNATLTASVISSAFANHFFAR